MTDAVIIVLREVLEAMLLICLLMASSTAMGVRVKWLVASLVIGMIGASLYGVNLETVSMAFAGFGQELVNSGLLIAIALLLAAHNFLATRKMIDSDYTTPVLLLQFLCIGIVSMAVTREGAEIYLYLYAYGVLADNMNSVFSGGAIGMGVGLSFGTFFYYGLSALKSRRRLLVCCVLSLVLAAGMMGQAAFYLSQADILPSQFTLWDTSGVVAESSLIGELLHAAIGYEASPTLTQAFLYLGSILISLLAMLLAWWIARQRVAVKKESC